MSWEMFRDRLFVDKSPFPLPDVSAPTVIYKEGGILKSKVISKSGVWLPLFRKNGPSTEELERVFGEIEYGK